MALSVSPSGGAICWTRTEHFGSIRSCRAPSSRGTVALFASSARRRRLRRVQDFTNFSRFSPSLFGLRLDWMRSGPGTSEKWSDFARRLAVNLRQRRDAAGLTQEQVAELAGISLYAYQTYERGTAQGQAVNPRLATVLVLSQVLDTSLDDLLPEAPRLTTR